MSVIKSNPRKDEIQRLSSSDFWEQS